MSLKDPTKGEHSPGDGKDAKDGQLSGVAKPTGKMNDSNSTEPYNVPKGDFGKTGGKPMR